MTFTLLRFWNCDLKFLCGKERLHQCSVPDNAELAHSHRIFWQVLSSNLVGRFAPDSFFKL